MKKLGKENIDYVENLTQVNNDYDVAIVVYGEQPYAEGVGDRKNLNFDGSRHISALNLLKQKGIPTVSIFLTGRPLWVTREINLSDSFVVAWLPGTESRGMTDVLLHNDGSMIMISLESYLLVGQEIQDKQTLTILMLLQIRFSILVMD